MSFFERDNIEVKVSQQILWVGKDAYPLHNIARAKTVKIVPRPGVLLKSYAKAILLCMLLGLLAGLLTFGSSILHGLAPLVLLALIALSTIKLIWTLFGPTLYALVIETAGTPQTALYTRDETELTKLVHQIMDAISNPQKEFRTHVVNYHYGDKIQQFGDQSVGKVTR